MIHIIGWVSVVRIWLVQAVFHPAKSGYFRSHWRISGARVAHEGPVSGASIYSGGGAGLDTFRWDKSYTSLMLMCRIHAVTARQTGAIQLLHEYFGERPFRVSEAVAAGISSTTLHRLRQKGELATVGRGVVQLPDAGMGMLSALAVVSARVPRGTICLNSALAFWDLTDEVPRQVHVAVPRGAHRPSLDQPPTKVHVFDAGTFEVDRQNAQTDANEPFWVYSPERSVVDAMRMGRWVGHDIALHALRRYMAQQGASPARLSELARQLGGSARLQPALEALLS